LSRLGLLPRLLGCLFARFREFSCLLERIPGRTQPPLLLFGTDNNKTPRLHVVTARSLQTGIQNFLQIFVGHAGTIKAGRSAALRNRLRQGFLHDISHP